MRTPGAVTSPWSDPMRRTFAEVCGWCVLDGTGTIAIKDSENVASITDNGTGDYTVTWAVPMKTANYAVVGSILGASGGIGALVARTVAPTAAALRVKSTSDNVGTAFDSAAVHVIVIDELLLPSVTRSPWSYGAQSFCKYNSVPGTPTIDGQRNVSSLTDNGAGDITINWARAYANAFYAVACGQWHTMNDFGVGKMYYIQGATVPTASALRMQNSYANGINSQDSAFSSVAIFGH